MSARGIAARTYLCFRAGAACFPAHTGGRES